MGGASPRYITAPHLLKSQHPIPSWDRGWGRGGAVQEAGLIPKARGALCSQAPQAGGRGGRRGGTVGGCPSRTGCWQLSPSFCIASPPPTPIPLLALPGAAPSARFSLHLYTLDIFIYYSYIFKKKKNRGRKDQLATCVGLPGSVPHPPPPHRPPFPLPPPSHPKITNKG